MNKQKFFRIFSLLGMVFIILATIGYVYTVKNRGPVIEDQVEVPERFASQFDRVLTRNRYMDMKQATFMSPEGKRVNWQVFDGKYLLVNFWATWCPPCVLELPSLNKLKDKFEGQGLEVIAISMDTSRTQDDIKKFLKNRGIGQFAAYLDDVNEVQKSIYMRGLPTSYLLNPSGQILYIFEGDAVWSSPAATDFFETILNVKTK